MNRTIVAGSSAALALFLLVGCGSGDSPAPALPPVSTTAPNPAAPTPSTSSAPPTSAGLGPDAADRSGDAAAPGALAPGGPAPGAGGQGSGPGGAPGPTAAPAPAAPSNSQATGVYAARFCTALSPLIAFKQRNETPNLAGVTNGQQAKDLAVGLIKEGVSEAQEAVNSINAIGPAPDPQAAAGIDRLLTSLRQVITFGQGLLPKVQAVDPNNPTALIQLGAQAQTQLGTSQSIGLDELRSSTGPALSAALRNTPACSALGI